MVKWFTIPLILVTPSSIPLSTQDAGHSSYSVSELEAPCEGLYTDQVEVRVYADIDARSYYVKLAFWNRTLLSSRLSRMTVT